MRLWRRLQALVARQRLDLEFDDEARSHIDLATHDYLQRGYPPAEARRMAHVMFGATQAAKDAHRDSRGLAWFEGWLYDVRHAVRGVTRDRMYAFAVITILGLSLGLNVTTFRIVDATLLHGYPKVKKNARLLFVDERYPTPGCCVTWDDFEVWREQAHSFQGLAFGIDRQATLSTSADDARDLWVPSLTSNAFHLLGVAPVLGRDFRPFDERPGAEPVAIVSHRYWITHLGGRADVIGQKVFVNQSPVLIIGVMPQGFDFPAQDDIWLPLKQMAELHGMRANGSYAFGRLRDGASEKWRARN